jgi:hypothetical protein
MGSGAGGPHADTPFEGDVDWVLDLLYIYIYNESGSGSSPFWNQKFMAWNKKGISLVTATFRQPSPVGARPRGWYL